MPALTTQFITVEIDLQRLAGAMHHAIEAELQKHGDPLRWAVTTVNVTEQTAIVEAIVTTKAKG